MKRLRWGQALLAACPSLALATDLDGSQLSILWSVPFAGILVPLSLLMTLIWFR
jgi:hypothetical protein